MPQERSVFSDYKHHCSAKYMGAGAANGASIDTSEPRGGGCDDKTLTVASGVLERAYAGFTTVADKGFMMHAQYMDVMHELLTPPKKARKMATFTMDEMGATHTIVGPRSHVKRMFKRGQEWKTLHKTLNLAGRSRRLRLRRRDADDQLRQAIDP